MRGCELGGVTEAPDGVTASSQAGVWLVGELENSGISRRLEAAGVELAGTVVDAQALLTIIDTGGVRIALVDGTDGLPRDLEMLRAVPFIVMDQDDRHEMALAAWRFGADGYLALEDLPPVALHRAIRDAADRGIHNRDVRRRIEAKLASERNMLRAVIDNLPDPIYVKDREGRYILDNLAHVRFLGRESTTQVMGRTVFDFFEPGFAEQAHAVDMEVLRNGEPSVNHEEETSASGQVRWLTTSKVPLRDERGVITGLVCINRDITQRKLAQDRLVATNAELERAVAALTRAHQELHAVQLQLIEAEKLKTIGRLAAGVAHEVKNPLAVISMGTEFLSARYASDETTAGVLKELADAVQRADGVIKGLLDYSVPRSVELKPQDLNLVIKAVLRLVRGEIREGQHRVELELGEIPETLVDRGKMMQVFLNLITNALQAMPDGGVLTVRTRVTQMTSFGANVGGEGSDVFRAGDRVVIAEILDTGPGIPDGMQQRIFEPFVTTKATGKGTGLGLSVVRSIVKLHHGTIVLRNREEGGTAAILTLKVNDFP